MTPQRRHTIGNDRELAVRAAYSERTGESPDDFVREHHIPEQVRDE